MSLTRSVVVNIIGRDNASSSFLRVSKAADKAANSADRAVARLNSRATKLQAVGQKMGKSITLPLLAIGAVAVDQAVKFQKSLAVLNTATGESVKNLDKVGSGIKKIAVDTGSSLGQLMDGMYLAEKAGYSLSKGGLTVLKAAAQGAKAENVDLSVAMTALTSIMTSYGLKASDAVKVENQLIVGSGLAKTTMTDFANSLSNVVPIAAGLHISFAQVAGAIATMTQHGETAQRATENLANLMTNLAGSNNVATNAMQQLGVDTVDLQRHLGQRGLTGTLQIVLNALKKHGKAGLVVYDTFRKSSLASQSMKEQLAGMTGPLKAQSKAFASGKEGYKEYQKFFRSLGGKDFALGSQFAASVKSFDGFNNLIRQGRGNRQTYAKWLQQALGGVTGLKAMLMLLGGNFEKQGAKAGTFAGRVKKVADAAKEGGKNVHGWGEISKTAAVKFDKMKAKLQVLSETIGEKLLPYVVKIVEGVGHLVDKFNGLSGTNKKIIGWSLVILAAMGPVMAIFGRFGRLVAGAFTIGIYVTRFLKGLALANVGLQTYNTSAFRAGVGVRGAFSNASGGARMMGAAVMGLAIGTAWGMLARNSSTATKTLAVLGSTAAGALSGAMVAGAPGAVVGGLAGLISSVVSAFGGESDAAKRATAIVKANLLEQKQVADELYNSLISVRGAQQSPGYRTDVLNQLRDKGLLERMTKGGLDPKALLNIVTGVGGVSNKQYDQFGSALTRLSHAQVRALNNITIGAGHAEKQWEIYNAAQGKGVISNKQMAAGLAKLSTHFQNVKVTGFAYSKIVSSFSGGAVRNTELLKEYVGWLDQQATKQLKAGRSVQGVTKWLNDQKGAFANQLMVMGANGDVVQELIGRYDKLSHGAIVKIATAAAEGRMKHLQRLLDKYALSHPSPKITAKIDEAEAEIARLQLLIDNMHGKNITIATVHRSDGTTTNPDKGPVNVGNGAPPKQPKARGGTVKDGWFTSGERGWELGYKRGNTVKFYDNKTSQKMTGWDRVPGFAKGTSNNGKPDQSALSQSVSDVVGRIGQQYSPPFDASQVGLPRLAGQLAAAIKKLREEVGKGLKKSLAEGFEKQIKRLAKLAEKQLAGIRLRIKTSDLKAISKGLASSVDEGRTAYDSLVADMKAAGASAARISRVRKNESAALANDTRLLAAKDYRSSIADTLRGSFDSTQYGSVEDLLAGFGGATSMNNSYSKELSSLRGRAKGNKGLLGFINQLAASGQTATLQTLYGASGGELGQVSKAVSSYNASVASGSDSAEITKFGQSVNTLVATQDRLAGALAGVAHAFLKDSAKPIKLQLHVNGKEIAAEIVHTKEFDKELAGLLDAVVNHHTYKH